MLELRNVHVSFHEHEILTGVSCVFEPGKITGLIGDNGAGKTTLLRTATTMLVPTQGQVRLHNRNLLHQDVALRRNIGALIEKPGHYDELTVRENLSYFFSFHCNDRRTRDAAASYAIKRFHIDEVAEERVGKLSTGFRQRAAVARAFHPQARVVLLDEPLAGLDPTTRTHLKHTMRVLAQDGVALCLSSHGLSDLDTLCDRLYVLAAGQLHEFSSFDQIRELVGLPPREELDLVYSRLITMLSGSVQ